MKKTRLRKELQSIAGDRSIAVGTLKEISKHHNSILLKPVTVGTFSDSSNDIDLDHLWVVIKDKKRLSEMSLNSQIIIIGDIKGYERKNNTTDFTIEPIKIIKEEELANTYYQSCNYQVYKYSMEIGIVTHCLIAVALGCYCYAVYRLDNYKKRIELNAYNPTAKSCKKMLKEVERIEELAQVFKEFFELITIDNNLEFNTKFVKSIVIRFPFVNNKTLEIFDNMIDSFEMSMKMETLALTFNKH